MNVKHLEILHRLSKEWATMTAGVRTLIGRVKTCGSLALVSRGAGGGSGGLPSRQVRGRRRETFPVANPAQRRGPGFHPLAGVSRERSRSRKPGAQRARLTPAFCGYAPKNSPRGHRPGAGQRFNGPGANRSLRHDGAERTGSLPSRNGYPAEEAGVVSIRVKDPTTTIKPTKSQITKFLHQFRQKKF